MLGALGVVYGDIGTSPLYALKICFSGAIGVTPTESNILGILSLVFWSVTFVVGVKYLFFVLRADNHGEGGILALLALASRRHNGRPPPGPILTLCLFAAAMLFGDGMITPAISVLSAVEGLSIATHRLEPIVLPLTTVILCILFMAQKNGTGNIGRWFGPIMLIWFVTLAVMGLVQISECPHVLRAINPWYAVRFLLTSGVGGYVVLGGVFLCITGAEALYADMGHFGRPAIQAGWYGLVMPSLLLNYFGQGALLILHPESRESPFYSMVPHWGLYPLVALATMATIIASQALISGAFSLNSQAIQLGYCPRLTVMHTSREREGQIYIPEVNWTLMICCLGLVWGFKSSENLASAYGVAVTGDMVATSIIFYIVMRRAWGWSRWKAVPITLCFLIVDVTFLGANLFKFFEGGWVPLLMAFLIFTLMTAWKDGRKRLAAHIASKAMPLDEFLKQVTEKKTVRVPGTAVFMTANPRGAPPILVHHWQRDSALHEMVVLLSIVSEHIPAVPAKHRMEVKPLGQGFHQVIARYGYMQTPNVPLILKMCSFFDLEIGQEKVTYYLGREHLIPSASEGMSYYRKALFVLISRNTRSATAYFGIPLDQVEELGMQVEL